MKTAILTGSYGAIGKAIAQKLANEGFDLMLPGRNERQLRQLTFDLIRSSSNKNISWRKVDLSLKKDIEFFASSWDKPLDLLINNAATAPRSRELTEEGLEVQWATNVLGYFRMIQSFYPFMKNREDARIVNVASYWAGDLDFSDLEFSRRRYNNDTAYRQSKQANRMLTASFAKRLSPHGIAVFAAHPGDVNSKLSNSLGYGGWASPEEGADTPLFCALESSLKGITAKYFENRRQTFCPFMDNEEDAEKLHEICSKF
jgi:NAD(P)-dependent dehydrogenase (short-subunit alcohol dehydrogenase family)